MQLAPISEIGVRDDLFERGMHPLLAVRLMSQIEQTFGKKLPVSALFQGSTIENLATLLRKDVDLDSGSPLVAIQPLGSKPPVYFVHTVTGNTLCYMQLAQHLGLDQPFYGFEMMLDARAQAVLEFPAEKKKEKGPDEPAPQKIAAFGVSHDVRVNIIVFDSAPSGFLT
jgi:hypothetical protein